MFNGLKLEPRELIAEHTLSYFWKDLSMSFHKNLFLGVSEV